MWFQSSGASLSRRGAYLEKAAPNDHASRKSGADAPSSPVPSRDKSLLASPSQLLRRGGQDCTFTARRNGSISFRTHVSQFQLSQFAPKSPRNLDTIVTKP